MHTNQIINRLVLFSIMFIVKNALLAQTVVWSEDFDLVTGVSGYAGANGSWSVSNTGANGGSSNVWYVSGLECGNSAGSCGSTCATDHSLHMSTSLFGDNGAIYMAGGLGFWFVETDKRMESPTIDLTGHSDLTLSFNYIEDIVGQIGFDAGDDATLWYFDGASWSLLDPLSITVSGCDPQGSWTSFSIALPISANNNSNVKIGFRWINNDDNVGTDPSFAVDDIEITKPLILPVEMSDFKVEIIDKKEIELQWQTLSETNNDYFQIEKSLDGFTWVRIGEVKGAGSSSELLKYSFIDGSPDFGENYYRLSQIDFDGLKILKSKISIHYDFQDHDFIVYPNPASQYVNVKAPNNNLIYEISLYDLNGSILYSGKIEGGLKKINLDGIETGIYYLKIVYQSTVVTKKISIKNFPNQKTST